ncbi:HPr family phosphocarrier protein [Halobacillus litoralis]|uniref:HPr family phosphocarrier protein n=1 Tax=Halobacillus litoralis TaxID=45668 RepID=UPI001CD7193F|nr:HPr family phosphocarrier protein [Halobacillus litoralis]MCA0972164.1 HPr family phosphocarrier protein [Halobacillus litoralis]
MEAIQKNVTVHLDENQTIVELSGIVQSYDAEILIKKDVQGSWYEINLKSILGLINLQLKNGDVILLESKGKDRQQAMEAIESYFSK